MQRFDSTSYLNESDSERQTIAASQAVKPLPPLPRGWSRVCHETGLFLRGIGLGIVVTFFEGIFAKNFLEPEKIAIRQSRITALLRTLIHVVPMGVAIFEIVLNFKGHFVGQTFDKQNYLQFAAKAHEIVMQASVATILLSYIRYQISAGKGMPFGAVLSGLQFLQVSYLWSVEFWSSILSKEFQWRRKTCFAVLVLVCITVAATAGPSSASLLIPRQHLWHEPSTYLLVNASALDLWPDRLDGKKIKKNCAVVRLDLQDSDPQDPDCPISDFSYLLEGDIHKSFINALINDVDITQLEYSQSQFSKILWTSTCPTSSDDQFCGTTSQTAPLFGYFSTLQKNTLGVIHQISGYQSIHRNYYQPYTVASCVTDVAQGVADQSPLRFARISETYSGVTIDRDIVSIPGLTKGQVISNISGDISNAHVDWVDLPTDVFNTGIPGAVIVNSHDPNGSLYNITTCTLNAGWGSSGLDSMTRDLNNIYSYMSNIPSSWPNQRFDLDAYGFAFSNAPTFANFSNFCYPQRRISVFKDWMEFLNPTVVLPNNLTGKYIPLVLSHFQELLQSEEVKAARLLGGLLTVALASTGIGRDWEIFSDRESAVRTCDTCLVFEIEYSVYGWLYSARGTPVILAITVMLAYCTLVFGHVIYSAISGVSSTAWDSTAELVALAMNSTPTQILQNTCAGIIGRQALKTSVRVLATTPAHLELVFGTVKSQNAQTSRLVVNQKYGNLTEKKTTKKMSRGSRRRVRFGKGLLLGARSKGRVRARSDSNTQGSLRKRAVAQPSE